MKFTFNLNKKEFNMKKAKTLSLTAGLVLAMAFTISSCASTAATSSERDRFSRLLRSDEEIAAENEGCSATYHAQRNLGHYTSNGGAALREAVALENCYCSKGVCRSRYAP